MYTATGSAARAPSARTAYSYCPASAQRNVSAPAFPDQLKASFVLRAPVKFCSHSLKIKSLRPACPTGTAFLWQEALPAALLSQVGAGKVQLLLSVTSLPCELRNDHLTVLGNGKRYMILHRNVKASQKAVCGCLWRRCLHLS